MTKISILFFFILIGCSPSEDDWIVLFNGENFDGWHSYRAGNNYDGWYIENEVLTYDFQFRTELGNSYLVTDKKYTNFELSLEWMISEHGNSGVFWGVVEDERFEHPYQTGPEIQILDDDWTEYLEVRGDINRAGSLYNMMAPSAIVSNLQAFGTIFSSILTIMKISVLLYLTIEKYCVTQYTGLSGRQ